MGGNWEKNVIQKGIFDFQNFGQDQYQGNFGNVKNRTKENFEHN